MLTASPHHTYHSVTEIDGTRPWQHYHKDITITPETESLRIILQLSKATGFMQAKNISLRPLQKNPWLQKLQIPARICFSVFLLYLIFPYLRNPKSILTGLLLCIIALMIIAAISLPAKTKNTLTSSVKEGARQITTTLSTQKQQTLYTNFPIKVDSTKIGHFILFIFLGLLLQATQPRKKSLCILIDIVLFAGTTELIQLYIDGRGALLTDAFIDCSGGFLGVAFLKMKSLKTKNEMPPPAPPA